MTAVCYAEWGDSIKADLQRQADAGIPRLLVFVHGTPFQTCTLVRVHRRLA